MTKHHETTTVEATVAHLDHLALLGEVKAAVAGMFGRRESRGSFWDLVTGLLMNLPAAGCWTIAVRHEVAVRREARGIEGGERPPRLAVAAAGWELGAV
jgi:hypothetical protein